MDQFFNFPCEFPLKVIGLNDKELIPSIKTILANNQIDFIPETSIQSKASAKGNYLAITITFQAISRSQLDSIYLALNNHKLVKLTL